MTADMESWFGKRKILVWIRFNCFYHILCASGFSAISTSIAAPVGSYIAGYLTERYGLRKTIMFSVFPAVLGWLGIGWATTHLMLFTGRCVLGAAFGLANAVYQVCFFLFENCLHLSILFFYYIHGVQVYLAECSDPYIRSVSLNISYVALSLGVVLVYWLGSVFHWHSIALFNISLPILSYIALYFSPESPVWLVRNNRVDEALTTMTWLRGNNQMAIEEIKEISRRIEHERIIDSKNNKKLGFCDELRAHGSLKPFLAINVFIILMTLGGGYLFVIYAVDIVAGLDKSIDSFKVTTLCGLIRLIINILFCPLFYYVKRRPIYIVSGVGAGISVLLLGGHLYACENRDKSSMEVYFDCFLMLTFIALSTTFTVAPTFMIGELLPSKVRARIAGYLHANYGFTFFVFGKFLPLVSACYKIYTVFLIFGLATLVSTLLVFLFLPETKDKTLNQIEDYFKHTNWIYSKRRFEECSQLANAELMEKNSQP